MDNAAGQDLGEGRGSPVKICQVLPRGGLVCSLQAEWQYLCCVCPRAGLRLAPLEEALWGTLIPVLFGEAGMNVSDDECRLYASRVCQGGLSIRIPTEGAERLHGVSKGSMAILVRSLVEGVGLSSVAHKECA